MTSAPAGYIQNDTAKTVTISTAEGMAWLASVVNGLNSQTATTLSGYTVSLTADIDLSNHLWTAVGPSSTIYFAGTFNGNGHTIKGLYINSTIGGQGLFGHISGAIIKNIAIGSGYIDISSDGHQVGSIVGELASAGTCEINNCSNAATVKTISYNVGGLIGWVYYTTVNIYNCYNTGTITTANSSCAGGIIGCADHSSVNIYNSYNTGAITAATSYAGGIVGIFHPSSTANIYNCYNTGAIKATTSSAGGIIGNVDNSSTANVYNCYNTGSATSSTYSAGGIIGYCYKSTNLMVNCYSIGAISATNGRGGILGTRYLTETSVTIKNCHYLGASAGAMIGGDYDGTNWTTGTATSSGCATFTSADNSFTVSVNGGTLTTYSNLYGVLTAGVTSYSTTYPSMTIWFEDYATPVNGGYPVLHNTFSTSMVTSMPATGYAQDDDAKTVTISTANGLAWLSSVVNGVNGQTANTFTGYTITLTADIDLIDYNWIAIGTKAIPFSGTFDGGSHIINNLYINVASRYQGLFGCISNATIKNVIIGSGNIYSSADTVSGIAGFATGTCEINNCSNSATVKTGIYNAGGIIGDIYSGTVNIYNCYNSGVITATTCSAGGIIGLVTTSAVVNIYNCYNTGVITATTTYAGGMIGLVQESSIVNVYNSYNTGIITATTGRCAGGIIGLSHTSQTNIYNCYNTGAATSGTYGAGGIVAACYNASTLIANCYNTGVMSATNGAGGILGAKYTTSCSLIIKNCYYLTTSATNLIGGNYDDTTWTTGTADTTSEGNATFASNVGTLSLAVTIEGLSYSVLFNALQAGKNYYGLTINNLYNWAVVSGTNNDYPILFGSTAVTLTLNNNSATIADTLVVKLYQGDKEKYTLTFSSNTFTTDCANAYGDYKIYINGVYSGQTINIASPTFTQTYTLYKATFVPNGPTADNIVEYYINGASIVIKTGEVYRNTFSMTDWTFAGFGTATNSTSAVADTLTMATTDQTLYALFTQEISINYISAGTSATNTGTLYYGKGFVNVNIATAGTKTDWTFIGWSNNPIELELPNISSIAELIPVNRTADDYSTSYTYYAMYSKIVTVT